MQSPHPTSPKGGEIEWAPARGPLTSMYNPRHETLYLCSVSNRLPHRAKRARSGNHGRAAPPTGPRQRSSPRVQRRRSPTDNFVVTSPNAYNQLGLGTTQLYNKRVVYNQKRHGTFPLGNRMVTFERRLNVPRQLSPEFLLVDLVNELDDLAED